MIVLPLLVLATLAASGQEPIPFKLPPGLRPAGQTTTPNGVPEIWGMVVVTGDANVVAKERKARVRTLPEVLKDYPAPRYRTARWGDDRLIVVDLESGPLGAKSDRRALIAALSAPSSIKAGCVRVSDMSQSQYDAAKALFGAWPGHITPQGKVTDVPHAFGIKVDYVLEMESNGVRKQIYASPPSPAMDRMRESLRQAEFAAPAQSTAKRPLERDDLAPRDETRLFFMGRAMRDNAEGTRRATELLAQTERELGLSNERDAAGLMTALGLGRAGAFQGELSPEQVPRALWNRAAESLADRPGIYGFANAAEATEFLRNCTSVRLSTNLLFLLQTSSGDPTRMIPSSGVAYQFLTIPGGYLP